MADDMDDFDDFMDEMDKEIDNALDQASASNPPPTSNNNDDESDDESDDSDTEDDLDDAQPQTLKPTQATAETVYPDDDNFDDFEDDFDDVNIGSGGSEPTPISAADEGDLDGFDSFNETPAAPAAPIPPRRNSITKKASDGDQFAGKPIDVELAVTAGGLGMSLAGPPVDGAPTGVFVSKVKELGTAYANGKIKVGMWIIEVNGEHCGFQPKSTVAKLIKGSKKIVKLKLQYSPKGFAAYDGGKELIKCKQNKASKTTSATSSAVSSDHADKWFVGKQIKEVVHEVVLSGETGDFVVRDGSRPGTAVIVVNDHGQITNFQVTINQGTGSCAIAGRSFGSLDDVIDHFRVSPQKSKKEGSPKYVLKSTPLRARSVAGYFDFMAWSQNKLRIKSLPTGDASASTGGDDAVEKPKKRRWSLRSSTKAGYKQKSLSETKESKDKSADTAPKEPEFQFPVTRVAIAKRDAPSFGMSFIGPEPGAPLKGVFISRVSEDGPAGLEKDDDGNPMIKVGMRILGMNGKSVQEATKDEAVTALKSGSLSAVMTLQMDPVGFAYYDKGILLEKMRAEKNGKKDAAE